MASNLSLTQLRTVEFLGVPLIPLFLDTIKPLNESRQRRLIFVADYSVDTNDTFNYVLISIHECQAGVVAITILLTVDAIFVVFMYHACGQLEILGYKFKTLINIDYVSAYDERNTQKKIKFYIEKHKSIIMFVNEVNDCFSVSYFVTLGLHMIMISFTGVQLVTRLDSLGETLAMLFYIVGQIFRLFLLTLPSQRLIDQSNQLIRNIYDSYWYTLSLDSKNLLKTVMLRCIKPTNFTAGKVYCFSISNFGSVIKTSVSYFTVLLSLRE